MHGHLSEAATATINAKIAEVQKANGGSLKNVKADDAFRAAFPDYFDLHDWRMAWNDARHAEDHGSKPEKDHKPGGKGKGKGGRSADTAENGEDGSAA